MEFLTFIKTSIYLNFTLKIFIVGFLGVLYVFFASIYSDLKIFRNKDFIFLGFSLPVLGFVITTVIGTNIALSLGMVGALSIIRFRTPVRSPFELIIYFALLTMGIATSVNYRYTIILFLALILFKLIYKFISKKIHKLYFSNKILKEGLKANLTININKSELSNFINNNTFIQLSCEKINNDEVEVNLSKAFDSKKSFETYLSQNKNLIKNFFVDEN